MRAHAAEVLIDSCRDMMSDLSRVRGGAVNEMHDLGLTWAQIGPMIGTSRERAFNVGKGRDEIRAENREKAQRRAEPSG